MSVHFKFKSSRDYDHISFDGSFISLGELKQAIILKKKLNKSTDFDLIITNAQTSEDYTDEAFLVPKNTSVVVRRVPITTAPRAAATPDASSQAHSKSTPTQAPSQPPSHTPAAKPTTTSTTVHTSSSTSSSTNLAPQNPAPAPVKQEDDFGAPLNHKAEPTENDKISALVNQAGGWQQSLPAKFGKYSSSITSKVTSDLNKFGQNDTRIPGPSYICRRCNQPGHFISNCPTNKDPAFDIKKTQTWAGVPKTSLKPLPDGSFAMIPNNAEFEKAIGASGKVVVPEIIHEVPSEFVPPELKCSLCKNLLIDSVLITCCGNSFCHTCIRDTLPASSGVCPMCQKPGMQAQPLIPNQKLRQAVDGFKKRFAEQIAGHEVKPEEPTNESGSASNVEPRRVDSPTESNPSRSETRHEGRPEKGETESRRSPVNYEDSATSGLRGNTSKTTTSRSRSRSPAKSHKRRSRSPQPDQRRKYERH